MKKKKIIILVACILLLCVIVIAFASGGGKKPYKDLDAEQIASATVHLSPPDKTVQIVDIEALVEYLKDVVIHNEDNSYTEYAGQGVTFTLTRTDGTQTEIMAYNPFLVIDGVGYKTDYEPCEVLNNYANKLLNAENANIVLEEPPALAFVSENTNMGALLGTYSWHKMNSDGTTIETETDSAHPLDCKDLLLPYETTEATATLNFTENPDKILSVRCWSDEHWADPTANSEDVIIRENVIELKPGGYIYEVTAEWDTDNGYGGTANYSLYLITVE